MGISKPIVCEIAKDTFAINEFGMATCFLLMGREKGLVFDAGCGMYNIREVVDELCDLPYEVVISHSHGDHVGSIDKWDEIWLHPDDWDALDPKNLEANKKMLSSYPGMMAAYGTFEAYDVKPEQIRFPEKCPKLLPLEDGQIFDLGGRKVEVVHTPGHTAGEVALIDPNTRILFSGDSCNINLGIRATSINTALKGLLKLKAKESEFDRNFNSHIGYGGSNVHRSMPDGVLDECLHIMRGIIDGTADVQNKPSPFRPDAAPTTFVKYGNVLISFDPNRIIDEGETPAE